MAEYQIIWRCDIDAKSPKDAANQALAIMRKRGNEAKFFTAVNKISKKKYTLQAEEPVR